MPTALPINLRGATAGTCGELRARSSPPFHCDTLLRLRASDKLPRLHLDELRRISRLQAEPVEAEVTRNVVRADLPVDLQTHSVRMTAGQSDSRSSLQHAVYCINTRSDVLNLRNMIVVS